MKAKVSSQITIFLLPLISFPAAFWDQSDLLGVHLDLHSLSHLLAVGELKEALIHPLYFSKQEDLSSKSLLHLGCNE